MDNEAQGPSADPRSESLHARPRQTPAHREVSEPRASKPISGHENPYGGTWDRFDADAPCVEDGPCEMLARAFYSKKGSVLDVKSGGS